MAWKTGTSQNYRDLLRIIRHFVTGRATVGAVSQTGTGNGTLTLVDPAIGAVTQTWTLTCTAGGATGTFSVVGSVSGAMAAATVGTPYSNAALSFLISDGSVDFTIGAQFVFTVIASTMPSGERWVQNRWTDGATTQEALFTAPGLAAADEIYCGLRSYEDTGAPYYFIDVAGQTGYLPGNDFYTQPGTLPSGQFHPGVSLSNSTLTYWLVANGRRLAAVIKVGTIYEALHAGFYLPYATPGQHPYPLFIGGSMTGEVSRSSALTGVNHRHFTNPGKNQPQSTLTFNTVARFRAPDGTWRACSNFNVASGDSFGPQPDSIYPFNTSEAAALREAPGSVYPLTPLVLMTAAAPANVWGELDGCYHVSGFGLAAEDIITVAGQDYLAVPNVYRTGIGDFWALKLA